MAKINADERRSARSKVMLTATIETTEGKVPVRIDDLSAHGARVLGNGFPPVDTPITFRCKDVSVDGFVAWVQPPLAGIGFDETIPTQDALRKVAPSPKVTSKDFRRPGLRGQQLTRAERRMVEQWVSRGRSRPGE